MVFSLLGSFDLLLLGSFPLPSCFIIQGRNSFDGLIILFSTDNRDVCSPEEVARMQERFRTLSIRLQHEINGGKHRERKEIQLLTVSRWLYLVCRARDETEETWKRRKSTSTRRKSRSRRTRRCHLLRAEHAQQLFEFLQR